MDIVPLGKAQATLSKLADISASKQLVMSHRGCASCSRSTRTLRRSRLVVDLPRSTVRHPETILHVDKSRITTGRSSTVDGQVIHWQLHLRAWISTTSLFTVTQPVWSNYQNSCYRRLWSLTSQKSESSNVLNTEITAFNHNVLFVICSHWSAQ